MSSFPSELTPSGVGMPAQPPRSGRILKSSIYFFNQLATNFTGVANETQQNLTQSLDYPLWLRGATTELSLANLIQIEDVSGKHFFSDSLALFGSYMGQTFKNEIYRWWRRPYPLDNLSVLRATMQNHKANQNGNIIFFGERIDGQKFHVLDSDCCEYQLPYTWAWKGVANQGADEVAGPIPNAPYKDDLLILGAQYSGGVGTNKVLIQDEGKIWSWSLNPLRFEYFFGMIDQPQSILWYPVPYFVSKNTKIKLTVTNTGAQNSGTFFASFLCLRGFSTFDTIDKAKAYAARYKQ